MVLIISSLCSKIPTCSKVVRGWPLLGLFAESVPLNSPHSHAEASFLPDEEVNPSLLQLPRSCIFHQLSLLGAKFGYSGLPAPIM